MLHLVNNRNFPTVTNFFKQNFLFIVRENKSLKKSDRIKVRYQRDEPCGLTSPDLASDQYGTVATFTFCEEMLESFHRNYIQLLFV